LIAEAYCLPVQVVKHPFLDIPLVLPGTKWFSKSKIIDAKSKLGRRGTLTDADKKQKSAFVRLTPHGARVSALRGQRTESGFNKKFTPKIHSGW